jgi:hypothetical protein
VAAAAETQRYKSPDKNKLAVSFLPLSAGFKMPDAAPSFGPSGYKNFFDNYISV